MSNPALNYQNDTPLLPQENIFALEARSLSTSKTETDIYGNQINIQPELLSSEDVWSIGAAYVPLATVTASTAAYAAHTQLKLVKEDGTTTVCQIAENPTVDRHKTTQGDLVYTVKLTLRRVDTAWDIPVISTTGPRLFGR